MSLSNYCLLGGFVVLAFLFGSGQAIWCYQCNTFSDPNCGSEVEKYESEFLKECEGNATKCRKIEHEIYYSGAFQERTVRQCAYDPESELGCLERTGTNRYKVWYCHCDDKKGCNSAHSVVYSIVVLGICYGLVHLTAKHL